MKGSMMALQARRARALLGLFAVPALLACSSKGPVSATFDHRDGGPDGGGNGVSDGGGSGRRDGRGGGGGNGDSGIVLMSSDSGMMVIGDGGCGSVTKQAGKIPVDIVLVVQTSFSMQFDNKWTTLSAALVNFVNDPASSDLDLGMQFFPLRLLCEPSAYEALAVPVGPQPMAAPMIQAAIEARATLPTTEGSGMFGATPTVQVLEGIIAYLQANTQPGHKPVIVMATDGVPDLSCIDSPDGAVPNSLANAETIAAAAFAANPSIPLFVIGVGSQLTPLNQLAAAGGTTSADSRRGRRRQPGAKLPERAECHPSPDGPVQLLAPDRRDDRYERHQRHLHDRLGRRDVGGVCRQRRQLQPGCDHGLVLRQPHDTDAGHPLRRGVQHCPGRPERDGERRPRVPDEQPEVAPEVAPGIPLRSATDLVLFLRALHQAARGEACAGEDKVDHRLAEGRVGRLFPSNEASHDRRREHFGEKDGGGLGR